MPVPEYVLQLRRRVGHDLLWLPGVTSVVLGDQGVLLVRRADDGTWSPVSGIVDPGEHPADTAVREVLEETAVTCTVEDLVYVNVSRPVVYPNGDRAQYLDHTFRCRYVEGTPHVADDESLDVAWFELSGLPSMADDVLDRVMTAVGHVGPPRLT